MSYELSTPVKIVALAGLVLALAGGSMLLLFGKHATSTPPAVAPPAHHARVRTHTATTHARTTAPVVVDTSVPAAVRRAFAGHKVVVAVVYSPAIGAEAGMVKAAAKGAHAAGVGFAALDVTNEKTAKLLALEYPYASDPSVLIMTGPHSVVTSLDGVQESAIVAQAAADARR